MDNLSKRSKAAEKAFFNAYKCVTDISDPVPVLLSAIEAQKGLAKVRDEKSFVFIACTLVRC